MAFRYGPERLPTAWFSLPGGRPLHQLSYEADELRRSWKKCSCPIYASGTLKGEFRRKNTERTQWSEAKALVAEWESVGSWSGPLAPVQPAQADPSAAEASPARISIADAMRAYLAIREGAGVAPATLRKHRTFIMRFRQN